MADSTFPFNKIEAEGATTIIPMTIDQMAKYQKSPEAVFLVVCDPFYERTVSDLGRSMNRSLWIYATDSSFIEGSCTTKNTASACIFTTHHILRNLRIGTIG
jgi:hypothetical protein